METTKCLSCQKDVAQKKGKRAKLYCSDLCRATYHQNKKQELKVSKVFTVELPKDYLNFEKIMVLKEDGTMVPIDEFPKTGNTDLWLQAFGALKQVRDDSNEPLFFEYNPKNEKVVPISSPLAGKSVTVTLKSENYNTGEPKEETEWEVRNRVERIATLENELKHPPKTAIIGVKNWIKVREKELAELKSKI